MIISSIIGIIIGAALGALIGALIIRFATKLVAKFVPPFGMAYKASFLGVAATYLTGYVFGIIDRASGNQFSSTRFILLTVISFFIYAVILGPMIKHPQTGPIGFGKACLVSLAQIITMVVIVVLLLTALVK